MLNSKVGEPTIVVAEWQQTIGANRVVEIDAPSRHVDVIARLVRDDPH